MSDSRATEAQRVLDLMKSDGIMQDISALEIKIAELDSFARDGGWVKVVEDIEVDFDERVLHYRNQNAEIKVELDESGRMVQGFYKKFFANEHQLRERLTT